MIINKINIANAIPNLHFKGYMAGGSYKKQMPELDKDMFIKQSMNHVGIKAIARTAFDYEIFEGKLKNIFFDLNSENQSSKRQGIGTLKFDETGFTKNLQTIAHDAKSAKKIYQLVEDDTPIKARFILNQGTKEEGDKVIKTLINAVRSDQLKINEIRVYRQNETTSYASRKEITKLVDLCTDKFGTCKRVEKQKATGYHGIHIICELDRGTKGEIQIMGKHTEDLKDVEDVLYRLTNNKLVDKKFKQVKRAYENLSDEQKENLTEYTKKAYFAQRSKELNLNLSRRYTPLNKEYNLPNIFDFNNLAKY